MRRSEPILQPDGGIHLFFNWRHIYRGYLYILHMKLTSALLYQFRLQRVAHCLWCGECFFCFFLTKKVKKENLVLMIWHRVEHTFYLSFLEANMQKPRWVFWQTLILRSVLLTKTYAGVWFSRWWMHFIQVKFSCAFNCRCSHPRLLMHLT